MQRLTFFARGTALVTDPDAMERGIRRFVGRRWQEVETGRWAWVPTEKPQALDYHHDLVKACKEGDLWPADEATAKTCGVGFDPDFGGEETESIKSFRARRAAEEAAAKAFVAAPADEKKKVGKSADGKGDG